MSVHLKYTPVIFCRRLLLLLLLLPVSIGIRSIREGPESVCIKTLVSHSGQKRLIIQTDDKVVES